ncbi:heme A synthase [Ahniella affigens]|uniref:Heme A synthase n=1 Tax=Ahniella affigens TaxID=2021234 RepID=A0A2P1PUD0_9GAMM|nr:COX15/CtaA family protein [Ahniella affigens]AVP98441.1 heme A synthase [Ahniella affigens]
MAATEHSNPPSTLPDQHTRAIGRWLLFCCGVLLALVMVGGATRLTESGLSIVEWKPVTGVLPPMSESAWQAELQRYRASPQYQKVNRGMSVDEFKTIFWYEYVHRLLARLLGLCFALPFFWFLLRGRIPRPLRWPLVGVLLLGAAQGYMGWYMVKSGLVDIPRVSHYRLTAHLSLALAIYASMFWIGVNALWPRAAGAARTSRLTWLASGLLVLTILFGALVAGLRAGLVYNTFPLMGGQFVPPNALLFEPWWLNFLENLGTVQFTHRWLAISTLAVIGMVFWRARARATGPGQSLALKLLLAMVLLQVTLGISTLLLHVPVWLGTLHQGGAVLVLSALLWFGSRGLSTKP